MAPVLSICRPGGNTPPVMAKLYGAVPPPAIACPEYTTPRFAYGWDTSVTKANAGVPANRKIAAAA